MTKPKMDEFFSTPRMGPKCWRQRLSGEQLEFFVALEAAMADNDTHPNWAKVSDRARQLGPPLTANTISRHYRGQCLCGTERGADGN